MAIKINSVNYPTVIDTKYIYKDLHLDLQMTYSKSGQANKLSEITDAAVDYDISAISNSIFNLFTTIPGQKILNPDYGLNLVQFLFVGVTSANAQLIGETIQRGINTYEARVTINQIGIQMDPEHNQYTITLALFIPQFNKSVTLKGILNNSGFYYI